jgi:hypothetical protein
MDMLVYDRAMAAFCRQQARFDQQNERLWLNQAQDWAEKNPKRVFFRAPDPKAARLGEDRTRRSQKQTSPRASV